MAKTASTENLRQNASGIHIYKKLPKEEIPKSAYGVTQQTFGFLTFATAQAVYRAIVTRVVRIISSDFAAE